MRLGVIIKTMTKKQDKLKQIILDKDEYYSFIQRLENPKKPNKSLIKAFKEAENYSKNYD